MNVSGALLSALIGALGWILFAFVGTPIRKFWDLRGEVAHAMNKYARNISEPPENYAVLFAQPLDIKQSRDDAAQEFRRVGLLMISFWQNEAFARLILRQMRMNGEAAGQMLLELSEANTTTHRLGPRRSDLAATLRLKL
jgi:hypothetical protein